MLKIIVPIDFSIASADALRCGCYLADVTGYGLEAVHVYDGYDDEPDFVEFNGSAKVRARVKEMLEKFVRVHADPMTFTGIREKEGTPPLIETREVIGSAINQLVKQSRREDVALIVMGGVGTGLSSRVTPVFGSVARSVALRAACPVLLIPKVAGVPRIHRAAIAFDGVNSLIELREKSAFLRKALALEMRFTHVAHPNPVSEEMMALTLRQALQEDASLKNEADYDFLPTGDVANTLLDYILERDVDLLIMGRHAQNFLTRLIAKSEISELLGVSGAPILVIPLTDKEPLT